MVCVKSQSCLDQEQIERLNRARDFFGDCVKRRNDWITLIRGSKKKALADGHAALVLDCRIPSKKTIESELVGLVQPLNRVRPDSATSICKNLTNVDDRVLVVLKANTLNSHNLVSWNQQLMLVHNVHFVNGPESKVPIFVGFYRIKNQIMDKLRDLLLFESTIKKGYKFLPRICDWEPCPVRCSADAVNPNDLKVQDVKSSPEIMQSVSDDECGFIEKFCCRFMDRDDEKLFTIPDIVFLNGNRVKIGVRWESFQEVIQVDDVLFGPLDLEF
jgi:hypothetical protein